MRLARLAWAAAGALAATDADAGCCSGSGVAPTWLARDDVAAVSVDTTATFGLLRWDSGAMVRRSSTGVDEAVVRSRTGVRLGRHLQLSATFPWVVARLRGHDPTSGPGDVLLRIDADPWTPPGSWLPILSFAVRAPSGAPSASAEDPGTGLRGTTLSAGGALQGGYKTLWRASVEGGVTALDAGWGAQLEVAASAGRKLDEHALMVTLEHTERWTNVAAPDVRLAWTRAAVVGIWEISTVRLWAHLGAELPVPGLGVDGPISARVGAGVLVRWEATRRSEPIP